MKRSIELTSAVLLALSLASCLSDEPSPPPPAPSPPALALHVSIPAGDALESLTALASAVDWTPPSLPLESARVEYHAGVSHSLQGVLPKGRVDKGRPPEQPLPTGKFVHEFHHDADGLLAVIVQVTKDGQAKVTSRMIYDAENRPVGRLTYGSFGDFVHHDEQGQPGFAARLEEDGSVLGGLKPL